MKSNPLKPHQVAILAAGVASLVLWAIPGLHWLMLPMQYLNTHLHEFSHALVAKATGGEVQQISVLADGSGVTPILGGNILLSASAGYVGAAIIGALIMYFSRGERQAHVTLRVIFLVLAFSMVLWVRGDGIGLASGAAWLLGLAVLSQKAKGPTLLFAAQFIGLQQCLNAAQSLYDLLRLSAFTETHSDAQILQSVTHVPAIAWALGWCAFSLAMVTMGLRKAWSTASPPSRPAGSP